MHNDNFTMFAPPMNEIIVRKGVLWRVCYHNAGQRRYSAELVAFVTKDKENDDKTVFILASDNSTMSHKEFEDYRRKTWPLEHEDGRNSDNVTLGVQSGSVQSKGGL